MEQCVVCGLDKNKVDKLVEINEGVYICNRCTAEVNSFFAKAYKEKEIEPEIKIKMYPKEIKSFLDEYVIGQEQAKKVLSVEVYNHFNRINNKDKEIQKNNILMIGKSGVGKTLLVQTLAKLLDLPLVIADMTSITQAGYVGKDSESILQQLVIAAGGDIKKAENGIIMCDEVDKLAKRNLTSSTDSAPSTEGAQTALLKIIEGTKVDIKLEGIRQKDAVIDTSNILFIGAGAFFGLDKILESKGKEENSKIGFHAVIDKSEKTSVEINDEDLINYGFLPEFIGRFPCIVELEDLTKEDYRKILLEPKNSIIKQYQNLLSLDGFELSFNETYINEVVDSVYDSKKGARGLKTIIEKKMRDIIYDIDSLDEKLIEV